MRRDVPDPEPRPTSPELPGHRLQLERGASLGRYLVLERLGEGGMGVVYAAYDPALDRRVALKLLRSERLDRPGERDRFRREALALARLTHPNVVTVHDVGTEGRLMFLATELVEGRTLDRWLAEEPRSWPQILAVFAQAGRGLEAAHAAGLVHRDFKPSNVILGRDGRARVMDFGLARAIGAPEEPSTGPPGDPAPDESHRSESDSLLSSPLTRAGAVLGTPGYMAPEQYRGEEADARTDQFAFCVALYEALYGETPFPAKNPVARLRSLDEPPRKPSSDRGAPKAVREALLRGLSPRREDRFPDMAELLTALERGARTPRRSRLAALAAATILLIVVGAWWMLRPRAVLPEGGTVLLLPMTGEDAWVSIGLTELVASGLGQLPGVDVLTPGDEIAELRSRDHEDSAARADLDTEALARLRDAYGADLLLTAELTEEAELYTIRYAITGADGDWRERSVRGGDPLGAANELVTRLGLLLAPDAARPDLRRLFSEDPFVNRVYATGLAQMQLGGPSVAASYFRVALAEDPSFQWARLRLAEARHLGGEAEEAEDLLDEVLAEAETGGDFHLLAAALHERGSQAVDQGRLEAAEHPLRRALELHRDLGEAIPVMEDLLALGHVAYRAERLAEAERWWREAIELADSEGNEVAVAKAVNNLALLLGEQDRLDEAAESFQRAADTFRRLGMRQGLAIVLGNLGQVAGDQGRFEEARRYLGEELELQEALGNRKEVLINLANQAWLATASGDCGDIRPIVDRGVDLARRQRNAFLESHLLVNGYLCATITGEGLDGQDASLRRALEVARGSDVPGLAHGVRLALAEQLLREGRSAEARSLVLEVEAAGPEVTGDPEIAPYLAAVQGRLALAEDRAEDAVRLLERALADFPIDRDEDRDVLELAKREAGG